jgi:hypothetical protein
LSATSTKELLMRRWKAVALSAALGALAASVGACDQSHKSSQVTSYDTHGATVSQMPGGFRNYAFKCEDVAGEWFAVFVTSDGGATNSGQWASGITAIPDPKCASQP